ncbi:flagellin lysine-N-methylase, partial [Clostridioides difficile]|nr:flagellin lysine-N-methylase [Clostridioides difficile]
CRTCRLYPRHIEEFEGVREITLSLSCPAVAKILMNRREPVAYLSYEKEGEESYGDFDLLLYSVLADAREVVLNLLKNRALPVEQREEQMLSLADAVQKRHTDGMLFSCQELFCAYGNGEGTLAAAWEADGRRIRARLPFMMKLFSCLDTLELLREDWKNCLDETRAFLHMGTADSYAGICLEFGTWLKERMPEWE